MSASTTGSGLAETTYLVLKPGGQSIQLSRLLYLVLDGVDGIRTVDEIAEQVSAAFGRTVSADNVGYLVASKLEPLGLVPGGGAHSVPLPEDQPLLALKATSHHDPRRGRSSASRAYSSRCSTRSSW